MILAYYSTLTPWSLCSEDSTPYLQITSFINTFARVSLSVHLRENVSVHLLNKSVTTNTYQLPWDVTNNGLIISHDSTSKGCFAVIVPEELLKWVVQHCVAGKRYILQSISVHPTHTLANSIIV